MLNFRETVVFTKQVVEKLSDSEYLELQAALVLQPELGDLIPNSGGLRKLRWVEYGSLNASSLRTARLPIWVRAACLGARRRGDIDTYSF